MSQKPLQSKIGSGVGYGKPAARGRGITQDSEKQDSNDVYSFKTFGDKEEKGWDDR